MTLSRITHDPAVVAGRPCSREQILAAYPQLEPANIEAALTYTAREVGGIVSSFCPKAPLPPPIPDQRMRRGVRFRLGTSCWWRGGES